jgi:hypothetical protein
VPLSGPRLTEAVPPHSCPDWLFEAALPSAVLPGIRSQFEHRAVRRPWHPSRVCAVVTAALSFTGAHASPHAAFFSRAGPATPLSSPSIVAHRRSPSSFNAETRVSPPLSPLVRSTGEASMLALPLSKCSRVVTELARRSAAHAHQRRPAHVACGPPALKPSVASPHAI